MQREFFFALQKIIEDLRLVVNQIIEEGSGEAYWKARVESQGKVGGPQADHPNDPWDVRKWMLRIIASKSHCQSSF